MPASPLLTEVGFYGKLPSHGDFLRRRVSEAFVRTWDAWLQECLESSRAVLAERWLDCYLTSPVWRFIVSAGVCGPAPAVGLMAPSVDRVGRYFPLTLVAELPAGTSPLGVLPHLGHFLDRAERLVLDTLESDPLDFVAFEDAVSRLGDDLRGPRLMSVMLDPVHAAAVLDGTQGGEWQVPLGSAANLAPTLLQLLGHRLSALYEPFAFWWSDGSANVESTCLVTRGLPRPDRFGALLDGGWSRDAWDCVPAHAPAGQPHVDVWQTRPDLPRFRSAAASDVGRGRAVNQDSFIERIDAGVWAVADGLGGHAKGEMASRMVCDALADFVPASGFDEMVEEAGERLHQVNAYLAGSGGAEVSGSTAVVLLARGARLAVLWAGDSRAYRLRDGRLQQLTRDHSAGDTGATTAITRAVGGEPTLALDVLYDSARAGDRYLLCSDGLTRVLADDAIGRLAQATDVHVAVDGLIDATLQAGAPDNVTVLLIEAFDERDTDVPPSRKP